MSNPTQSAARQLTFLVLVLVAIGLWLLVAGKASLLTPDQEGYRAFEQDNFAAAADSFADPMWRGVALYRAGEFEQAAGVFAGFDTAEAAYNHGNALLFQGNYEEAVARYDRALELQPGWDDAATNREIARGRAERLKLEGGDMTGGQLGADDIVFTSGDSPPSAGEEQTDGGDKLSDAEIRALWLRQVQTRLADFLAAKFAYQNAMGDQPQAADEGPQ